MACDVGDYECIMLEKLADVNAYQTTIYNKPNHARPTTAESQTLDDKMQALAIASANYVASL